MMKDMWLDQKLVDAAVDLMSEVFPSGPGGAAALRTEDGTILISVGLEGVLHDSANVCHETGAILEAFKLRKKVVASVCVWRESGNSPILILSPCGMCQERLRIWGEDVEAAVPLSEDATKWQSKTLKELEPYYWGNVFNKK